MDLNGKQVEKTSHAEILTKSFKLYEDSGAQKSKNSNQLWMALESLNNKRAQQKNNEEQSKLKTKKAQYVAGLDGQVEVKRNRELERQQMRENERVEADQHLQQYEKYVSEQRLKKK